MQTRALGSLTVSALGLGCMGMSEFYGPGDEQESLATIALALDRGCTFLDTADMDGPSTNEQLVGRAIASRRDEVVLATEFGNERRPDGVPGTKQRSRLEENPGALDVTLTADELARLDELAPVGVAAGDRYPDMSSIER